MFVKYLQLKTVLRKIIILKKKTESTETYFLVNLLLHFLPKLQICRNYNFFLLIFKNSESTETYFLVLFEKHDKIAICMNRIH